MLNPITVGGGEGFPTPLWIILNNLKMAFILHFSNIIVVNKSFFYAKGGVENGLTEIDVLKNQKWIITFFIN